MPVFAEIHDGVVVNLVEAEHIDALPGLIDAVGAQIGDLWDGERFNAPPVDLPSLKADLIRSNNVAYESAFSGLTADYPPSETKTFERQREEVMAWEADQSTATPWIDIAAASRGLDRGEYLQRTLRKAKIYFSASAWITGHRQGIDDAIRAAKTPEQLAAIIIDYTLPEASA